VLRKRRPSAGRSVLTHQEQALLDALLKNEPQDKQD
jgi:hypothetical protein